MNDLSPDAERLRTLEIYLRLQLDGQAAWTDPGLLAMLDPCPDCRPQRTLPPRT